MKFTHSLNISLPLICVQYGQTIDHGDEAVLSVVSIFSNVYCRGGYLLSDILLRLVSACCCCACAMELETNLRKVLSFTITEKAPTTDTRAGNDPLQCLKFYNPEEGS